MIWQVKPVLAFILVNRFWGFCVFSVYYELFDHFVWYHVLRDWSLLSRNMFCFTSNFVNAFQKACILSGYPFEITFFEMTSELNNKIRYWRDNYQFAISLFGRIPDEASNGALGVNSVNLFCCQQNVLDLVWRVIPLLNPVHFICSKIGWQNWHFV